ncbi:MAG: tetratricopeptide repeat protein [bacterium]|nr:tetratricopeptide repeat protein [bacterium]
MPDHLSTISKPVVLRTLCIVVVIITCTFGWFAVRWQIGDLFADVTSAGSPDASEIAATSISLAGASPRGYWLAGSILKTAFDDQSLAAAIQHYEEAARRSPNHYRAWTELGRINEQAGRYEQAESAFRQAISLAPEYTIPHWQAGNFYLRRGRVAEAVADFNSAAKHSSPYRLQIFSAAWSVLGQDPRQVEQFLTDSGDSKATLAYFYGSIDRPDDALRVWNMIEPDRRYQYKWQVNALARDLLAHGSYRGALEFSRQGQIDPEARPEVITNGDFELAIKSSESNVRFDWTLARLDGKVDVSADTSTMHGGGRSLKFVLRGYAKPQFNVLAQAVAIVPGERYRLSFWIRTENLRGGSLPFIEIRSARIDQIVGSSSAFPTGTNEWQRMDIDFALPEGRDGIYLVSGREPCPEECPLTGMFWLDDFSLKRLR